MNRVIPNLIVLGVQKAGTTSFHDWLSQHPDVFSNPDLKDRDFFTHPERKNDPVSSIKPYVKNLRDQKFILHTHVNYLIYSEALCNIHMNCGPKIKLIVVLRDPVDRALSAYRYFVKLGREERPIFEALVYEPKRIEGFSYWNNDFTYLEHGFYCEQLEKLLNYFSREDLLLLDYKQLISNPTAVMSKVCSFLGIPDYEGYDFQAKNVTGEVKYKALNKVIGSSVRQIRKIPGFDYVFSHDRRRRIKERLIELNTKKTSEIELNVPDQVLVHLNNLFLPDVRKLINEYGFSAAENWGIMRRVEKTENKMN